MAASGIQFDAISGCSNDIIFYFYLSFLEKDDLFRVILFYKYRYSTKVSLEKTFW